MFIYSEKKQTICEKTASNTGFVDPLMSFEAIMTRTTTTIISWD